jgi:hypothetical protein
MVHALEESWRVLRPNGVLIDLRTFSSYPPVEIVSGAESQSAGHIDDTFWLADDLATDEALDQVLQRGLFEQQKAEQFSFSLYWNSVDDMQAYAEDGCCKDGQIPSHVLRQAKRLADIAGDAARIRIRQPMILVTYGKMPIDNEPNRIDES